MQPLVLCQPVSCCSTPGLLNHLAQRTPVALCIWELTPLMQALRIPSGWLYTITQLVTLLQYRYKVTFQELEVRRSNKDISINFPRHPDHDSMSWTACYDDNCPTHRSDKDCARWYPSKPRSKSRRRRGNNKKPTLSRS